MDPERPINAIDCENLSLERILKNSFRQLRNDRNSVAEILFGYIIQALNCREIDLQTLQTLLNNLWLQSKTVRFWL